MAMWLICGYMAVAAVFYLALTATATDITAPSLTHRHRWHRARKGANVSLLRRLRSGLSARPPKHGR